MTLNDKGKPADNGEGPKVDDTRDPKRTFEDPRNQIKKFLERIVGKTYRRMDSFEKIENLLYLLES